MGVVPTDPWVLFLIGLGMGTGPCLVHQLGIVVPFVGAERSGFREGLREMLWFSLGRGLGYGTWGLVAGAAGTLVTLPEAATTGIQLLLGLVLAAAGLASLLRRDLPGHCRGLSHRLIQPRGRAMFLAGLSVAALPCLPLLAVIAGAGAAGPWAGLAGGLAVAAGSSLSPALVAAPVLSSLAGRLEGGAGRAAQLAGWLRPAAALVLFGVGLTYSFQAVLALTGPLGGAPAP